MKNIPVTLMMAEIGPKRKKQLRDRIVILDDDIVGGRNGIVFFAMPAEGAWFKVLWKRGDRTFGGAP